MFCERCGEKNADDAKFCEKCGSPVQIDETPAPAAPEFKSEPYYAEENVSSETTWVREKKPMSLKNKIIFIAVAAVVILCTAFYFVGKSASDPEKIVEKFMDGLVNGNYAQVYDCFEIPEGQFTTKEMFVKVIENSMEETDFEIEDYSIRETDESSKLKKVYEIEMKEKGSSHIDTEELVLTKQKGKSWLFFDTYKIANDELVEKDVDIYIPAVATLKINGVVIDDKYKVDEGVGEKQYEIDYMFGGEYSYVLESPYTETSDGEFSPAYGEFHSRYLHMNDATIESLSGTAQSMLNNICAAAKEGKSWNEVESYFAESFSNAKSQYEYLCDRFKGNDGTGITTFAITGIEKQSSQETLEYGDCDLDFRFNYKYKYLYQDHVGASLKESDIEVTDSGYFSPVFTLENGQWLISNFDLSVGFNF